jgi:hypothetical protein
VESGNVNIDLVFEHDYRVREIDDAAIERVPVHEFKDHSWLDLPPHFSILVSPTDKPEWVGRFEIAYGVPPAINGVFATPRPDRICVVAGGQGFVIDVGNPKNYELVRCFPINSVAQSPTMNRMAFADFTGLEAWDANGSVWASRSVATDELMIVHINAGSLVCRGWEPDFTFEIDIDLTDGTVIGGQRMIASGHGSNGAPNPDS